MQFLATHDAVAWVLHPSLASHADYRLAKEVLPKGAGSMVSFGVKGGRAAGRRFIEACELASHLANVGDAKTLVIHPASTTHLQVGAEALAAAGVGEDMIRLSVGLEDPADIIADLDRALRARAEGLRSGRWRSSSTARRSSSPTTARASTPRRPTILFVHGAGMDHSVWPLQARHFAYRGWNALAPDLPGHGRSGGALRAARSTRWPTGCGELIKALELDAVTLVGHSMGALIGLESGGAPSPAGSPASRLLGAAPRMPVHPALLAAAARPEPRAAELICDWGFGPAGHFGGHKAPGSWMMGHGMRLLDRAPPDRCCTPTSPPATPTRAALRAAAKLRCPTLVLAGELDRMTPARQAAQARRGDQGRPLRHPAGLLAT